MKIAIAILLLGSAAFANTGFFAQSPNPAHGFDFQYAQQESFVINGWGSTILPLCSPCTPGSIFYPNTILSPVAGIGDFGYHRHHVPLTFTGAIDVIGNPFKIPANKSTVLETVLFKGDFFANGAFPVHSLGVIELKFSQGKLIDERLILNPEPGTMVLLGTGLLVIVGAIWTKRCSNQF